MRKEVDVVNGIYAIFRIDKTTRKEVIVYLSTDLAEAENHKSLYCSNYDWSNYEFYLAELWMNNRCPSIVFDTEDKTVFNL